MKKTIITLTKDKLVVELVNSGAQEPILMREVFDWKKDTLLETFGQAVSIAAESKSIRLLLTEDFFFISGFSIDKEYEKDREAIKSIAEGVIPEDLDKVHWDYVASKNDETSVNIQCYCLTKKFDSVLMEIVDSLPVEIEAIEPYPISIYHSFANNHPTFLLLYKDDITSLSMLVKDGLVVFSKAFSFEKFDDEVLELLEFSRKFYDFKIPKLIVAGVSSSVAKSFDKKLEVITADITAAVNLTEKKDIKGKDHKVLNVQLNSIEEISITDIDVTIFDEKKRKNLFFLISLALLSIVGVVIGVLVVKIISG